MLVLGLLTDNSDISADASATLLESLSSEICTQYTLLYYCVGYRCSQCSEPPHSATYICFSDGVHSSSALWMSWSNSDVYRLHGSICAFWTLTAMYKAITWVSQWHFSLFKRTLNIVRIFGNFWKSAVQWKLLSNKKWGWAYLDTVYTEIINWVYD